MAGMDMKTLEESIKPGQKIKAPVKEPVMVSENKWLVADSDNQWLGPFDAAGLMQLDWLMPYSWVRREGEQNAVLAFKDSELKNLFQYGSEVNQSGYSCPNCYHVLEAIDYEGKAISRCPLCQGVLIDRNNLECIVIREEENFSEQVRKMGDLILEDSKSYKLDNKMLEAKNLLDCPKCKNKMRRLFLNIYSVVDSVPWQQIKNFAGREIVPLVIDKCLLCDLYWLDKNKLEITQYIYEKIYGHT